VRARSSRSAGKRLSVSSAFIDFDLARLAPLDTHLVAARRAARRTRDVNTKRIA
jgi:hypothetical protein